MDVLQDEEYEILIMLVEVYEGQKDIEESIVDLSGTFAKTCYFLGERCGISASDRI